MDMPSCESMEKYFQFADFEIELDKRKIKSRRDVTFADGVALEKFKVQMYRAVYNYHRDNEKIELELKKFRELGREFYNLSERQQFKQEY